MTREIRINLIAKDDVSGRLEVISVNAQKTGETLNKAGSDGAKGMEQVSTAAERTTESLDRSAIAAGAFGATILSALVVPIGLGTKAAWDQVSSVEQATLALRAYESDARKVEQVLGDLLAFARTDEGKMFMRQELFAAAQALKVAGAETENLTEYVMIMSRSVNNGMGTWADLERTLQRVLMTGKLVGYDFDMLVKMGFQLDPALRGATLSAEELFDALDRGSVIMEGMSDTIAGQGVSFTTALRSLGLAFLQVDADTSQFIEGGLGERLYESFATGISVMEAMQPVARAAGESLAFLAGGAALAVEGFLGLPQGIQTTVFALVGGTGAIISGASLLLLTINKLTAGAGALRMVFTGLAAHPVGLALTALALVVGVGVSAWARHRSEVQAAEAAYDSVGETALRVQDIIANFKIEGGDLGLASQITEINSFTAVTLEAIQMVNEQRIDWEKIVDNATLGGEIFISESKARDFLDSVIGQGFIKWAEENGRLGPDIIRILMEGTGPELVQVMGEIQPLVSEFFSMFDIPPEMHQRVSENTEEFIRHMMNPLVDSEQMMADWHEARKKYLEDPLSPDVAGYDAWLDQYLTDLPDVTAKANEAAVAIDGLTEAQRDFRLEIAQLRLDGDSQLASDLVRLDRLILDVGEDSEETAAYVDFLFSNIRNGKIALSDIEPELLRLANMREKGVLTEEEYNQALIDTINNQVEATVTANAMADAMQRAGEIGLDSLIAGKEAAEEYREALIENLNALIEVAGYGDPLSRWNLEGNATALSTLAMNANQAANGLDNIFRVVVGNTSAIGSQFEQLFKWADELIAEEGVLSKLDDLVNAGRITGESGVFDGMSEYALAQQAFNSIAEDNLRVQEAVLTIQAKQAPLIAEQANAYADLMDEISRLPAGQQMVTLGWMDSATAMRAMEFQTLAVAAATGQLGKNGEEVFANIVIGAANADPILKAMLVDMGLISEGADGTITVNYDDVVDGKSEIQRLIESIDALTLALGGIPPEVTTTVDLVDNASGPLSSIMQTIANIDGTRAVTYVETIFSSQGQRTQQHGGTLPGYAMGGVLFRGAEIGPEIAHFAGGGTALLPRDGLYSAPAGTYISPNNAISNSYGGISVDFSGAVFNNTSREEMNAWAREDFIPQIRQATSDLKVGMGVTS